MHDHLARHVLRGLLAMDPAIGQIMEIAQGVQDGPDKTALKNCCGTLLRYQFDLMETIVSAYPELRNEIEREL
jgi:hypothetical protein